MATQKTKKVAPKPATKAVRDARANLERVTAEVRAEAALDMKGFAQEQMRRELARWVMAVRTRLDEIHDAVQEVYFACRKEDHLLYGLLDTGRLGIIYMDLESIDSQISMLTVPCELPDLLEVAKGYQRNWLPLATEKAE